MRFTGDRFETIFKFPNLDKPLVITDEQLAYANKRLDEQIASWNRKHNVFSDNFVKGDAVVHPPIIKNTHNFGNCVNCTDCKGERTEQDELQVVADKIKAGHEVMKKVKFDLMSLGTGIMFIDEKGNAKHIKLDDFFDSLVDEHGKFGEACGIDTMEKMNKYIDIMNANDPTRKLFEAQEYVDGINNETINWKTNVCGDCTKHGKSTCTLDAPNAIPSWLHKSCEEFEVKSNTKGKTL